MFSTLATRIFTLALILTASVLALSVTNASASKQVADFFGSENGSGTLGGEFNRSEGIAVNQSGAGPANRGDVYVLDSDFSQNAQGLSARIERFARDDNGTPAIPGDDSYRFISAWGAGVLSGGTSYEICTLAASCKGGISSAANGALGSAFEVVGDFDQAIPKISPKGIAIDQDTGDVYVADAANFRVNVYSGDGTFLRSFGYDVVASGPDQAAAADAEQKLTVKAGAGKFSLSFKGRSTGAVGRGSWTKGAKFIKLTKTTEGAFAVGEALSGIGIAPATTIAKIEGTELAVSQALTGSDEGPLRGHDLPYNASAAEVQSALNALPTIGGAGGSVTVTGGPGEETGSTPYTVHFGGSLGAENVPLLKAATAGLIGPGAISGPWTLSLAGASGGRFSLQILRGEGSEETAPIAFNASAATLQAALEALPRIGSGKATVSGPAAGPWRIQFAASVSDGIDELRPFRTGELTGSTPSATLTAPANATNLVAGGAYEVCVAAAGDVCKAGSAGPGNGEIGEAATNTAQGIAISAPDGNPSSGTVFLADAGNQRVNTYRLDGSSPSSLGSAAVFSADKFSAEGTQPRELAVDSRGILYASNDKNGGEIERYDTENANGGGVGFLAPIAAQVNESPGLAVDLDSDGAGPDVDVLYVLRKSALAGVLQFGPLNAPGLSAPPSGADENHGDNPFVYGAGIAVDEFDRRIYFTGGGGYGGGPPDQGVYILGDPTVAPAATLDSVDAITATAATAHATIDPNGPPASKYHFEYSTDGVNWTPTPTVKLGAGETPQALSETIEAPGGLEPSTLYHLRLIVDKPFKPTITTAQLTFTTLAAPPLAETVGAPLRTATTAQLGGRITPRNSPTTYSFQYGDQGPCPANPCTTTEAKPAGSGTFTELVAEEVEGLEANTTYHYRILADNGNPGSPVTGEDMTVTTRASDAPLSHGHLPGPPGSDRAWEQISTPDSGGNAVEGAAAISDDGTRATYGVAGGTPGSETGAFNQFFAERTPSGWQTRANYPKRSEIPGNSWAGPIGRSDLSKFVVMSWAFGTGNFAIFAISPAAPAAKVYEGSLGSLASFAASDDGSRVVLGLSGQVDPDHPALAGTNLYDVSSAPPRMVGLLPDGSVPACGAGGPGGTDQVGVTRTTHWLSADANRLFFLSRGDKCSGAGQLYMRDLQAEETKQISPPPLSGPNCGAVFIKSTPEAAFFWSQSRLGADDVAPGGCTEGAEGGDVYRYEIAAERLDCITCAISATAANVIGAGGGQSIAVAEDGSRVYFRSAAKLAAGAQSPGLYRIDVGAGDLAYLASLATFNADAVSFGDALNPDGSVLIFRGEDAGLNPLGGSSNAGTAQYYRYDDRDRSLICVSCPQDGAPPRGEVSGSLAIAIGPNQTPLSADGETFAFATPTPLLGVDQNTAGPEQDALRGTDVYEWRDGRLLLVTDGLTNWPASLTAIPHVNGVTPSGRDITFNAAARYTPDALDDYQRLYDAKIGGGIEFPKPPPPCPLEVCQGTPKGAPEEQAPGTSSFSGEGNAKPRKAHHKKHHPKHKKAAHRGANHHRRAAR